MHLMKPKDTEAPALRAARLCGLAAVGAGLLGSAALLHVTPVFAQAAAPVPPPVTAQPLAPVPPAAAGATRQAQNDAGKSDAVKSNASTPAARKHRGFIINDGDGGDVVVNQTGGSYRHNFTGSGGRNFIVYTDDARDLSPEEQRALEARVQKAEAKAAEVMKRVNSPEFKAKIAAAAKKAADVEARVNSPEFKARIAAAQAHAADVEKMINSAEFKARIAAATARGAEAEARINSPEFKARIAAASARAADVEKMVNSPEFQARIARAAEAAARVDSPEFRARMERLQRRLEDLSRDDASATPSSPEAPKPTP